MAAHITTFAFQGIEATEVDVQVQIVSGLANFIVVGLPDKAVAESRERVRAAIGAMGLALPAKRIIVNLAPADLAKEGSHFDLPIALALLVAMGVLPPDEIETYAALGELALDGQILPIAGVLPASIAASACGKGIICPAENAGEAAWAGELPILAPSSLLALVNHFKGTQVLSPPKLETEEAPIVYRDLKDVKGQETAKRALEIAAAGGHNLLMIGPPGSGKSMLASCLPGLLPPLTPEEMLDVSMIASVAGKLLGGRLTRKRPFRDPHHSASPAAMVGGGRRALPGEISLAHHGVLFLDEFPEFPRAVLESLRQPLETGNVSVARVQSHVTYPANFQLVAAMNPCRCGYLEDAGRACSRAPKCAVDYQARLSGPLLDRIDIHVEVPQVEPAQMFEMTAGEPSANVSQRVYEARQLQWQRFTEAANDNRNHLRTNADLNGELLQALAGPDSEGNALLKQATESLGLSMRGLTRVLRVARTIADLDRSEAVRKPHIAEALSYRQINFGR